MKRTRKRRPLEKEIQRTILDYLELRKVFFWRNNTGGFIDKNKHFYKFGAVGSADIFAIKKGVIYGLEVKRVGGRQSENQKAFQYNFEKAGGVYILAHGVEDLVGYGL